MRKLISLCMIVKNESARIRETLLSARAYVDRYTIIDTGSTDGTQEIIRRTMRGFPGNLVEEPFIDFAASRNRVLDFEAADPDAAVFTFFLSGDEVLCEGRALKEYLETVRDSAEDAYGIEIRMAQDGDVVGYKRWMFPRILRTGSAWRYVGKLHEQPAKDGLPFPPSGPNVLRVYVRHDVSDVVKRNQSLLEVHLPILEKAIDEDPRDAWALYYLAQTYGHLAEQIEGETAITWRYLAMSYYLRRALLDKNDKEMVQHCLRSYLQVAAQANFFAPGELLFRVNAFCRDNPNDAEAQILRLDAMGKLPGVMRDGFVKRHGEMVAAAEYSAGVAACARGTVSRFPVSGDCEWRSLYVAAHSAALIAKQDPEARAPDGARWVAKVDEFVRRGIEAGGVEHIFLALRSIANGEGPPLSVTSPAIERATPEEIKKMIESTDAAG